MVEHGRGARALTAPATFAAPIRLQIGARTLLTIPRRLVRVAWSLDDVLAGRMRSLPALGTGDGYLVTSVPAALLGTLSTAGFLIHIRQRYTRWHTDLTAGHAAWSAQLSSNARASLRRKAKRLASGGGLDVRAYRTPAELAVFQTLARPLSAMTYQERLLDAGLPNTPAFQALSTLLAEQGAVRAWLLFHQGVPIAYLWCAAEGDTLRYDYVGHDASFAHLSPGTVLHAEALRMLFEDRFARFDFTEGDGQHKRQFATGGTPCADVLLLRPTLVNRGVSLALAAFDALVATAKRVARGGVAKRLGDRIRRA
jgi:CelD/BcsL family acetyltransferase involved in cellulose biosynthesis